MLQIIVLKKKLKTFWNYSLGLGKEVKELSELV